MPWHSPGLHKETRSATIELQFCAGYNALSHLGRDGGSVVGRESREMYRHKLKWLAKKLMLVPADELHRHYSENTTLSLSHRHTQTMHPKTLTSTWGKDRAAADFLGQSVESRPERDGQSLKPHQPRRSSLVAPRIAPRHP